MKDPWNIRDGKALPWGRVLVWVIMGGLGSSLLGVTYQNALPYLAVGCLTGLIVGLVVISFFEARGVPIPWSAHLIAASVALLLFRRVGEVLAFVIVLLTVGILNPLTNVCLQFAKQHGMGDKALWIENGLIALFIAVMAMIAGAQLFRRNLSSEARWAWINAVVLILGIPSVVVLAFYRISGLWTH